MAVAVTAMGATENDELRRASARAVISAAVNYSVSEDCIEVLLRLWSVSELAAIVDGNGIMIAAADAAAVAAAALPAKVPRGIKPRCIGIISLPTPFGNSDCLPEHDEKLT